MRHSDKRANVRFGEYVYRHIMEIKIRNISGALGQVQTDKALTFKLEQEYESPVVIQPLGISLA